MRNTDEALIIKPLAGAADTLRIVRTRMTASERKALLVAAALLLLGASVRFYRHQCSRATQTGTEKNLIRRDE
ncbi:MAG: hypothetical protein PHG71_02325 [Kiritimatiellae bacterium]|nr:hypothetical protein [Kiritimatiellia bacterium]MDD4622052.1 hypothetical protein [Kiritimatiellia bacterium]